MKRQAILILGPVLITLFVFYSGAVEADNSCLCNQAVTLEGTVIRINSTGGGNYDIFTDFSCGDYGLAGVDIRGQGNPPASCKENSNFTVSGTVNCDEIYDVKIIPSKLICD